MSPRVVLTASHGDPAEEYLDALREAGCEPVRAQAGDAARSLLEGAQGLAVSGGVDVDPASYRADGSPYITRTEPERDVFEIDAIRAAREMALPTLCICRGMQIANVAFGGTLLDDILHHLGDEAQVRHRADAGDGGTIRGLLPEHVVRIEQDSALARIVGSTALVTGARHHQAVDAIAAELRAVARTPDGIVEAMEARFPSPFWLAVQWHPESTRQLDDGASRAIFRAFARAAELRSAG